MKVADIMQKQVDFVGPDTPLIGVARLIFGRGINGVPVCKGKKVVGFITERDILSQFYPSVQEYIEDPVHTSDFESMEQKIDEMVKIPAKKIMSKNPSVVTADTPLLRAQSTMAVNKVGRLPVVDTNGNLIGILSKGDIFRAVVGQRLPFEEEEQFHDWLSRRYDVIIDWKERFSKEIPDLAKLFKKEKVKNILDVGCGTGMHVIDLAKLGFNAVGIDRSTRMIAVSNEKVASFPQSVRQRMQFIHTEYKKLEIVLGRKFDAVMFMGAGLAHNPNPLELLRDVSKALNKKAIIICQLANYAKIMKSNNRLYDFNIRKSPLSEEREQAFLRFYDSKENGFLTQNVSIFAKGTKRWEFREMHAMAIYPLTKEKIVAFMRAIGFSDISLYGGERGFFYDYLFRKPFKVAQSDVLTVVAKRR